MEIFIDELRLARTAAGWTQDQLADETNYSQSLVAMVETGRRTPSKDFARKCDDALKTDGLLSRLLAHELRNAATPGWVRPWLDIERQATSLRTYQPTFFPGLLQTEAYAFAVLRDEARVATRMERQQKLDDLKGFTVVLDEAVLTRPIGDAAVMAEQIERLLTDDRVSVHVVPTATGYYSGLNGPFTIAVVDGSEVAVLDAQLQGWVIDLPEPLSAIRQVWEDVRSEALPRGQSKAILKEAYERWKL